MSAATRRLVVEEREDGPHAVSLPLVLWRPVDGPPPQPSPVELTDEIGLMLADAGIGEPPLVTYDDTGEAHLVWIDDLVREMRPLAEALALELRRARRTRRGARTRQTKPQGPAVEEPPKRKRDGQRRLVEVEQRDGRRQPVSPSDAAEAVLVVPRDVLDAIRAHAVQVDRERPRFESLGAVVCDGNRAIRYTKLSNRASRPERAQLASERQLRRPGGRPLVCVHSHPLGDASPSDLDLRWAAHLGLARFAIYSLSDHMLRVWRLDGDGVAEVEIVID